MNLKTTLVLLVMAVTTSGFSQTAPVSLTAISADQVAAELHTIPTREGAPPNVADGIPHQQFNQNAPVAMQEALIALIGDLPGMRIEATQFSLQGSQGWRLEADFAFGPADAFRTTESLEFGHLHQPTDGSMHMMLRTPFATAALEKGWGVLHPLSADRSGDNTEYVMIFGPRDEEELETIWIIVQSSYYYARGVSMEPRATAVVPATFGHIKDWRLPVEARGDWVQNSRSSRSVAP